MDPFVGTSNEAKGGTCTGTKPSDQRGVEKRSMRRSKCRDDLDCRVSSQNSCVVNLIYHVSPFPIHIAASPTCGQLYFCFHYFI
ncbi:Uncharacterized protein TCM_007161 [Theobroma cacao]|uniref:Uncharacterized protein n=1 Tax=Theobroma cacao TaxID=3641 RepID=A0A061E7Z0_THECC|nr:Uncharacterized protein TCM_007161 [Theobroma cacao]